MRAPCLSLSLSQGPLRKAWSIKDAKEKEKAEEAGKENPEKHTIRMRSVRRVFTFNFRYPLNSGEIETTPVDVTIWTLEVAL